MIENHGRRAFIKKSLTLLSGLSLYGCGGGGSGSSSTTSIPLASTTLLSSTPPPVLPSFLLHPSDQTTNPGESVTFQALANGSEPLSYQWQRDGSSIPGATGLSYTTPPVTLGDDALYSVLADNDAGTVKSREAQLTVIEKKVTVDSTAITVDSTLLTVDST